SKFDLMLTLAEVDGELAGNLEHSADLFDPATVLRIAGHLEELLAAALAVPARPWRELPLMRAPERWQVAAEWNDRARAYERDATLASLFLRTVCGTLL